MTPTELLAKLEAATVPTDKLDGALARYFLPQIYEPTDARFHIRKAPPAYTSSIDAAVTLCKQVLPGCRWAYTRAGYVVVFKYNMARDIILADLEPRREQIALALCTAVLRAYNAQEQHENLQLAQHKNLTGTEADND